MSELLDTLVRRINERFPGALQDSGEFQGDVHITIAPASLVGVAQFLRDDPELAFDYFLYNTAVDWPARDPRSSVARGDPSLKHGVRRRLAGLAAYHHPGLPALTAVRRSAAVP